MIRTPLPPATINPWMAVIKLLRWDKPAGRLILMIPALWAVVLASQGTPSPLLVTVIIAGSLATSAAGCVVNDLWDRNIDPQVERTRQRPLAAKILTLRVGVGVALVAFACAFGLALFLTPLSFGLCIAAVPVILLYPLAKRFFPIPQLVLALAWGFAVLISWSAVTGTLSMATWLLWGATLLWTLGFDTIYAMADRPDDQRLGINSSALFFGRYAPLAIGGCFLITTGLLWRLGQFLSLHFSFSLTVGLAALLWSLQVWQLQQPRLSDQDYGQLFRQNVWIGFLLLGGMVAGNWL
ncbi:4-hydroxybenzoate solanesyltransferase [Synechococcales cyanobacterium C]|uniref:4-hydroxybenzoate solanesyltransferase n=1 Tax=Petrachloros mirabilis ULC683 TaxID=2781853 RepID=A0A8K2A122_9CYAN|nr:4-hydroxybenzoate solanesyltransferase [Petrachloros mirabilis]NCJ07828.1 4-hydroxybenzoate solanesyltransferase [Petrachloros mirabilis ULC683]